MWAGSQSRLAPSRPSCQAHGCSGRACSEACACRANRIGPTSAPIRRIDPEPAKPALLARGDTSGGCAAGSLAYGLFEAARLTGEITGHRSFTRVFLRTEFHDGCFAE